MLRLLSVMEQIIKIRSKLFILEIPLITFCAISLINSSLCFNFLQRDLNKTINPASPQLTPAKSLSSDLFRNVLSENINHGVYFEAGLRVTQLAARQVDTINGCTYLREEFLITVWGYLRIYLSLLLERVVLS